MSDPAETQTPTRIVKRLALRAGQYAARRAATWRTTHRDRVYLAVHDRFSDDSMLETDAYVNNLRLAERIADLSGDIVECGTWRGGMIAGIASHLGDDHHAYHLFDSFEGLPDATSIDGAAALAYQANDSHDRNFDNCVADECSALNAMRRSGIARYEIHRGWFEDTLPPYADAAPDIALLRLDGDWYESTMTCLRQLHHRVVPGGLTIIDDYLPWDGCALAVHTHLADTRSTDRIDRLGNVVYMRHTG